MAVYFILLDLCRSSIGMVSEKLPLQYGSNYCNRPGQVAPKGRQYMPGVFTGNISERKEIL